MKDFRLYVILDRALSGPVRGKASNRAGAQDLVEVADQAILGGADAIQLRDKEATARELIRVGQNLRVLTQRRGVLFIVNDRVDLAIILNAEGVHLGQEDLPINVARSLMGKDKIIGISTHNLKQALQAQEDEADYIGIGPIFTTPSKPDYPAIGLESIREVKEKIHIPFVAIGGINYSNVRVVVEAGAKRIAVGRAIVGAKDIYTATRELKEELIK